MKERRGNLFSKLGIRVGLDRYKLQADHRPLELTLLYGREVQLSRKDGGKMALKTS